VGSDQYNQTLSENRAKSVYEYLIKNNISESRLSYKGFGESNPVATNKTDEGRQLNRRVEFVILSK
jgi:outer membrane protein OmpA-like peptidoglycan-associated protein